ncbi:hypothetical protein VPH35_106414 [Triticum aestivum]
MQNGSGRSLQGPDLPGGCAGDAEEGRSTLPGRLHGGSWAEIHGAPGQKGDREVREKEGTVMSSTQKRISYCKD